MENKKLVIIIVALIVVALGAFKGYQSISFKYNHEETTSTTTIQQNTETQTAPEVSTTQGTQSETEGEIYVYEVPDETTTQSGQDYTYTFRYDTYLDEHYEKHKSDTHTSSKEEYLYRANYVITNSASLHKTEKEDNDDIYYLESTNEFVVVSTDGYIRTYFCPDSGKAYYDKQ